MPSLENRWSLLTQLTETSLQPLRRLCAARGREVGVANPELSRCATGRAWYGTDAMLLAEPLDNTRVVLEPYGQLGHQIDGARSTCHAARAQCVSQCLDDQSAVLLQTANALPHPVAPCRHGRQRHLLRRDCWANGDGVLDLHQLGQQARREGKVAYAPAHHPEGLAEGKHVHHVLPADAGVRRISFLFVGEVFVSVVHDQPHAVLFAGGGQAL
mmetsp:Transcript_16998/g.38341  ORF Transcript_16998/g.38341 Transcript_16998/m.38341 type:complete len:214 (-) Transcript_16998:710-1351(-)